MRRPNLFRAWASSRGTDCCTWRCRMVGLAALSSYRAVFVVYANDKDDGQASPFRHCTMSLMNAANRRGYMRIHHAVTHIQFIFREYFGVKVLNSVALCCIGHVLKLTASSSASHSSRQSLCWLCKPPTELGNAASSG
jgi:hypothetical protein